MSKLAAIVMAGGLLASAKAAAQSVEQPLSPPPLVEAQVAENKPGPAELGHWGAMVDVGVPDGVAAAALYRPFSFLRLSAGGMTNGFAGGLRAGASLSAFSRSFIRPSLTVEYGHYFPGDANALAQKISGNSTFNSALLSGVAYDFANAHLGVELGSSRRFTFFLHGGYSRVWLDVPNVSQGISDATQAQWSGKSLNVQLNSVSAKLGFILFFG